MKINQFDEEDNEMQLGDTQFLNLASFIGKKDKRVSLFFTPVNSEITLVKLDVLVTIRPSNSKLTSGKQFTIS